MEDNKIETKIENQTSAVPAKVSGSGGQIAAAIVIAGLIIAGAILMKGGSGSSNTVVGPDGKKLVMNSKAFNTCLDTKKYSQAVEDANTSARNAGVNGTPKGFIVADGKVVATIDGAQPAQVVTDAIDKALKGGGEDLKIDLAPVTSEDFTLGSPDAKVTLVVYADFQCPFCARFHSDAERVVRDVYVKNGSVRFVYRDFAFLGPESTQAAAAARCAGEQGKFWEYHDYLFEHQNGENRGAFGDVYLKSFASELKLK